MHSGQAVGDYILTGFLGKGGMGEVWLAAHRYSGLEVAVKGLHSYLINDQAVIDRFRREAETLALLQHPNIAGLVEFVENQDGLYLVIEYVPGDPLDEVIALKTGPIPEHMAVAMFRQILKGVDYAHQRGIIHRDIKPSNFLVAEGGVVKILDFGIAKYLADDKKMTRVGIRMGTILYMSPEQVQGSPVDKRSDIYSLGVTLFQMLTGQPPYPEDTSEYDVLAKIVKTPLQRTRELYPGVSQQQQALIDRATEKLPDNRFQTCGQFLAALTNDSGDFRSDRSAETHIGPRKRKFKLPRILARMVPVMAVAAIVSIGFVQNWWGAFGSSPRQVADNFFDAVEERDQEEAQKWATEDCNSMVEMFFSVDYPELDYRVMGEEIRGDRATVSYYKGESSSPSELSLVKKGSKWKVSCTKTNLMEDE